MNCLSRRVVAFLASLSVFLGALPVQGDAILEGWQVFSAVESNDPSFGRSTTTDYETGFGGQPISHSLHVTRGGGVSDTQFQIDVTGLESSWTHTMAPGHEDAEPRTAYIYEFEVDVDSTYSLSGFYDAIGQDTRMSAIIEFREGSQFLFRQQIDGRTTDPSLTVGQDPTWPFFHSIQGSPTGALQAGLHYRLDVDVFLRQSNNGAGVQGEGAFYLNIVGVPEADSLILLSIGGLIAVGGNRVRKETERPI
jgi:hypothetical protein